MRDTIKPMLKAKKLFTYDDYAKMPEDRRYELVEGELVEMSAPDLVHQLVVGEIYNAIRKFVRARRLGIVLVSPVDVVLNPHNTLQPDVVFISKKRRKILTEPNVQGAPDLAVEVTSAGTRLRDRRVKPKLYEKFGVKEFWLVDRDAKTIVVHALRGKRYQKKQYGPGDALRSTVLPGFKLAVAPVFKIRI